MKLRALSAAGIFSALLFVCAVNSFAQTQELIPPSGEAIALDVGKGTLIRLERDADTVFVADPNIADVQVKAPKLIYLYGKQPGETSLYAVDAQQRVMINRPVVVTRDVARVRQAINEVVGNGRVDVQSVDGALMLGGTVASPEQAEEVRRIARPFVSDDLQLINHMKVDAPNQVNLRVRIAEVSHQVVKQLGINWDVLARAGSFPLGLATGTPAIGVFQKGCTLPLLPLPPAVSGTLTGTCPPLDPSFFTRNNGTNSILFGAETKKLDVNGVLDALDQNGLVKLLAEPNLTAMTGETASFLAGGQFPILVPQTLGQVTIQFKDFGIALAFTPVVLADGRISLRVRPEVSQLSSTGAVQLNGYTIPALTTRRAETTIELGSGQSFAIGGLMQNDITDTLKKLPGLGNLPVLGALFRSDQFQRDESELVIIVTPYLVNPVSDRLASPTDGFVAPTDADRLLGRDTHPAAAENTAGRPAPAAN